MYIELRPFLVHYDLVAQWAIPKIMIKRMASYLFCPCLPSIRSSYFQTPLSILMPCMRSGVAESYYYCHLLALAFIHALSNSFFPLTSPPPWKRRMRACGPSLAVCLRQYRQGGGLVSQQSDENVRSFRLHQFTGHN